MPSFCHSDLIRCAKEGSKEALNEILRCYRGRLLALIRLRLGARSRGPVESRDVLQETLLRAFRHFDQFHGSGERALLAWLAAIAQNVIRDQAVYYQRERRDVRRNVPLEEVAGDLRSRLPSQVSRVDLREKSTCLDQALDELGEARSGIVLMRQLEGLTYRQISDRVGKTPDACRMTYTRAITVLETRMRELLLG